MNKLNHTGIKYKCIYLLLIDFYYSILINILYQSIILKIIKLLFIGWIFTFILKF